PITTGPLSVDANGIITVAANTPSGTYSVTYQLCESDPVTGNNVVPANCDTATATVVVSNPIDAVNDPSVTVASTNNPVIVPGSVLTNDTLSGLGVTTTNTNVTPITTGPLSVDANGIITVAANTPSGTYSVTYQLCESDPVTGNNVVPANCDTATATVVVNNPIVAKPDNDQIPAGTTGHVIITANDTLNGKPIVVGPGLGEVTLTVGTLPVGIKYDPNSGTVSVVSTVADGTYTFDYTICENGAVPNNCQTTTVTIVVVAKVEANDDRYTVSNGSTGGVAGNVLTNDIVNNINQATTTNVVLGLVQGAKPLITVPVNSPVPVLDLTTGNVIVPPGTPSGQYTIEYEECLVINGIKVNVCDKATVTIQVEPEKGDEIVIYNHMTPNGDGYNDIFLIDGIDKFPNNTV
ncbi:hypothetical protein BWK62_15485, partial [Flavobacterium oreochromis]